MDCMEVFKRLVESNVNKIGELYKQSINVSNVMIDIESNLSTRQDLLNQQESNLENMNSQNDTYFILLKETQLDYEQLHHDITNVEEKLKN